MEDEYTVSGIVFAGRDLEAVKAEIVVKSGIITSVEERENVDERWILPSFFNAHTHIADTVAMDYPVSGSLSELVAPPNGIKHRLLSESDPEYIISAMRATIGYMKSSATAGFLDFREGGISGVKLLKSALAGGNIDGRILGRNGGEDIADGIGVSSIKEGVLAVEAAKRSKNSGKFVAFHAGEKDARDVDGAIDLNPDLLVHCTHATDSQLKRCADEGIPIAVCPRSNWCLGVASGKNNPPIHKMLDFGCKVLLGTDNVMFVQPDIFSEMSFLSFVYGVNAADIYRMAVDGSSLFGGPYYIRKSAPARFYVVNSARFNTGFSKNPLKTVVTRINSSHLDKDY
ncbi:amidohydrolase family protein [Methanoplanus endosymbiosus]|uniref:Amidohydrolase family protein n=1 Tax=Methanoplanus endosymbiosus TaxID=33865 RepID=A0A9E7PL68_9EURY|nr:amidohydrolase family protein [Methanoplanus endosymbiosus]UUX92148.1 amidohydrolase family protein [Methanoplanus endosymbiosus]